MGHCMGVVWNVWMRPEHTALRRSNEERKWYQRNVLSLIQTHKPRPLCLSRSLAQLCFTFQSLFSRLSAFFYISAILVLSPPSSFFSSFVCLSIYQLPSFLFSCSLSNATHTHTADFPMHGDRDKSVLWGLLLTFFPYKAINTRINTDSNNNDVMLLRTFI